MKINNYDRINVPNFAAGKENGYLCSMCGQYTTKNDSTSHQGYNLICMRCFYKMQFLTDDMEIMRKLHKAGRRKMMMSIAGNTDLY